MIYITERWDKIFEAKHVSRVWDVDKDNVEELYKEFVFAKAKELDIKINLHWFNIVADHKIHNNHLAEEDFKQKVKQWKKWLKAWNIDNFIQVELKGKELKYKIV